jgi:hypothetical protein
VHSLRAADALELAAATQAADRRPTTLAFVSLDARLRAAAAKRRISRPRRLKVRPSKRFSRLVRKHRPPWRC